MTTKQADNYLARATKRLTKTIVTYRKETGVSQAAVAAKVGLGSTMIQAIESGRSQPLPTLIHVVSVLAGKDAVTAAFS